MRLTQYVVVLFPEGGPDRFVATAFWPMLLVSAAGAALIAPEHRAILLSSSFKRVGLGRRTGDLRGDRACVVTADFGSRK